MNWRSHALIGFAASALFTFFITGTSNPLLLFVLSLFGLISALVPDLDHNDSKGKQILDLGIVGVVTSSLLFSTCGGKLCMPTINSLQSMIVSALAIFGAYFLFFLFLKPKHRGITHTIVSCSVYSVLICIVLGIDFAVAGFIGYFSHLAADTQIRLI
jgi:membrane-bound metal-dependent hydrolase YbcI (DUF457 family)